MTSPLASEPVTSATAAPDLWAVALGPAVTAAILAGLFAYLQSRMSSRKEDRKQLLEFRLRQINELYAPVMFLLAQDLAIAKALREAAQKPGQTWNLLNDLETIHSDPHLLQMARQIVEINEAIKQVLVKNFGLALSGQIPDSYHEFIAHADLVAQGVEAGTIPQGVGVKTFPSQFETDIETAYSNHVNKIQEQLMSRKPFFGRRQEPV